MAGYAVKSSGHAVNRGRQSPVPVIEPQVVPLRNGLSVQELKQMTAYRMSQQNSEKWKSAANAPPPVAPKPKERSPSHETTPSAMPHGLTVEEVKELTRIRLAKQSQEDVYPKPFPLQNIPAAIGGPPTIAPNTIKPRSPESHELRPIGTDFESISSILSAVGAKVQEIEATQQRVQATLKNTNASSHSEQRPQAVARANNGIVNQRPLQSNKNLLKLAIGNRMNHRAQDLHDDSSQFSDTSTTPPLSPSTCSPKSLRNRPKLSVSCPPPVKKRSASDSNDIPYEVAESVLLTPTPLSPRTPRDLSPRVMINRQDVPAGVINNTNGIEDGLFNGHMSSSSRSAYTPRKAFWTDFNSQAQSNDPNALIPPLALRFAHTYPQPNGQSAETLHPQNGLPLKYNSLSSSSLSSYPATHVHSNASESGSLGLGSRAPPVHVAGPLRLPHSLGMGGVDAPQMQLGFGKSKGFNGASTFTHAMPDDVSDTSSESDGGDDTGMFSFTGKSLSASVSGLSNMKPIERPGSQLYTHAPAIGRDTAEAGPAYDVSNLYRALPPTVVLSDNTSQHNGYGHAQIGTNSHTRSRGMPAGMGMGVAYSTSQM